MLRSSTIIRELALNPAKVIFILKHSVELRRYLLCGCVAACHGMACVLHAAQHSRIGRIVSMKNSNDTIWNRTRDLPICSTAP